MQRFNLKDIVLDAIKGYFRRRVRMMLRPRTCILILAVPEDQPRTGVPRTPDGEVRIAPHQLH